MDKGAVADIVREQRRLAILQLLGTQPERKANDAVLSAALAEVGIAAGRHLVRDELEWLEDRRLVRVAVTHSGGGGYVVGTLRERGAEVAAGRSAEPGVARPNPEF